MTMKKMAWMMLAMVLGLSLFSGFHPAHAEEILAEEFVSEFSGELCDDPDSGFIVEEEFPEEDFFEEEETVPDDPVTGLIEEFDFEDAQEDAPELAGAEHIQAAQLQNPDSTQIGYAVYTDPSDDTYSVRFTCALQAKVLYTDGSDEDVLLLPGGTMKGTDRYYNVMTGKTKDGWTVYAAFYLDGKPVDNPWEEDFSVNCGYQAAAFILGHTPAVPDTPPENALDITYTLPSVQKEAVFGEELTGELASTESVWYSFTAQESGKFWVDFESEDASWRIYEKADSGDAQAGIRCRDIAHGSQAYSAEFVEGREYLICIYNDSPISGSACDYQLRLTDLVQVSSAELSVENPWQHICFGLQMDLYEFCKLEVTYSDGSTELIETWDYSVTETTGDGRDVRIYRQIPAKAADTEYIILRFYDEDGNRVDAPTYSLPDQNMTVKAFYKEQLLAEEDFACSPVNPESAQLDLSASFDLAGGETKLFAITVADSGTYRLLQSDRNVYGAVTLLRKNAGGVYDLLKDTTGVMTPSYMGTSTYDKKYALKAGDEIMVAVCSGGDYHWELFLGQPKTIKSITLDDVKVDFFNDSKLDSLFMSAKGYVHVAYEETDAVCDVKIYSGGASYDYWAVNAKDDYGNIITVYIVDENGEKRARETWGISDSQCYIRAWSKAPEVVSNIAAVTKEPLYDYELAPDEMVHVSIPTDKTVSIRLNLPKAGDYLIKMPDLTESVSGKTYRVLENGRYDPNYYPFMLTGENRQADVPFTVMTQAYYVRMQSASDQAVEADVYLTERRDEEEDHWTADDAIAAVTGEDKDPQEMADILAEVDNGEIISQYEEEAGSADAAIGSLEQLTDKIDEKLAGQALYPQSSDDMQSGPITVGHTDSAAAAHEAFGEERIEVSMSGAAATAARAIREYVPAEGETYPAELYAQVCAEIVAVEDDALKMELHLQVKDDSQTVVVDQAQPAAPVTVTLKLPARYQGKNFDLVHYPDGRENDGTPIHYIWTEAGDAIRFVLGSLSPVDLENIRCGSRHSLIKTPAKAATISETGNMEYYTCTDCGKIFADADGRTEITLAATVIAKLAPPANPSEDAGNHGETGSGNTTSVSSPQNEQSGNTAAEAAKFRLNVANGAKIPVVMGKKNKSVHVMVLGDGDVLDEVRSLSPAVVSAKKSGSTIILKGLKAGKSTKITAKSRLGGSVTFTVKVQKKGTALKTKSIGMKTTSLRVGETFDITSKINPVTTGDKLKVTVDKKGRKVITVNKKGLIKAKKAGTAKITITCGKKKKTVTIKVK